MEVLKEVKVKNTLLRVVRGDITESDVDAIVNAANSYLKHGGGVAAAIVKKGGKIIQEESDKIGYVPVGSCAITVGGNLKAKYVIHAVGPRWGEGDEDKKLKSAINSTLKMATERGFRSISMPAISAGIFGFPKDRCAKIITEEIESFIDKEKTTLGEVNIYLLDEELIGHFLSEFEKLEKKKRVRLLQLLKELSYEEGEFILKSGKKSNYYVDARETTLNPEGMYLVGQILYDEVKKMGEISAVGGVSVGGDPLVCATVLCSYKMGDNLKGFFIRKEPKGYGRNLWIEGSKNLKKGEKVVILEDVVTTGASSLKAAEIVEKEGLIVKGIIALLDRQEGAKEAIENRGYVFRSIFTISDLR